MSGIDPDQVDGVLRRAVELSDRVAPVDSVNVTDLIRAAAEAGVPPVATAQAIAEARAGAGQGQTRRTALDRLVGPGSVTVVRATSVDGEAAYRGATTWVERGHQMRVISAGDGVLVAKTRTDAAAAIRRGIAALRGDGGLAALRELRAGVADTEHGGEAVVCLVAEVDDHQRRAAAAGGSVAAGSMAVVGLASVVLSPFAFVLTPVALGAGWSVARELHRARLQKVQRELDRTAASIAAGETPRRWRR